MKAWKMQDGRYRLVSDPGEDLMMRIAKTPGVSWTSCHNGEWVVPESSLSPLGAEKVYGVITGPSSCGCEPMMFRWVSAREVKQGHTNLRLCVDCTGPRPKVLIHHQCDIIDVCGEADVAREVYEAEFASKVQG